MAKRGRKPDLDRPKIFRFNGFRAFLSEWIPYLKKKKGGFTFAEVEQKTGTKANYLSMIVKGDRKMNLKVAKQLLPFLQLKPAEESFFLLLCQIEDARDPEERFTALKKAQRFLVYKENNSGETEVYHYLSHWYYPIIREMAQLKGFRPDPAWIRPRLRHPVSPDKIKKALKFLQDNGYIEVTSAETKSGKGPVKCHGDIYKISLSKFYSEMLKLQDEANHKLPSEQKYLTAYVAAIDEDHFDELKTIIDEARQKIADLENRRGDKKNIYYVNLGTFPVTEKPSDSSDAGE